MGTAQVRPPHPGETHSKLGEMLSRETVLGWRAAGWGLLQAVVRKGLAPRPVPRGPNRLMSEGLSS